MSDPKNFIIPSPLNSLLASVCGFHEREPCEHCNEGYTYKRLRGWSDEDIYEDALLFRDHRAEWRLPTGACDVNVLSLFSGIGGLELGLERAGMTVVGQVEIDPFCRKVLAKHWPDVPRHDDVRTCVEWWRSGPRPAVHVVAGGFPCQPFSTAGRRLGEADERFLWPVFAAVVRALRPSFVVMENVSALLERGVGAVLGDLAACGYDAEWDCIPAAAVGASHRRDRWFGVAYPNGTGLEGQRELRHPPALTGTLVAHGGRDVAHPNGQRLEGGRLPAGPRNGTADADGSGPRLDWRRPEASGQWEFEPDVGRVAHGVPSRVDRLRALGNAVVPQVAAHIGRLVMGASS